MHTFAQKYVGRNAYKHSARYVRTLTYGESLIRLGAEGCPDSPTGYIGVRDPETPASAHQGTRNSLGGRL